LPAPPDRTVTPDDEEDVDAELHQPVHHDLGILCASGCPEDGAALHVDLADPLRGQFHRLPPVGRHQPGEAVAEADDIADPVVCFEFHHQSADDVIQPRAQPTASDDPRPGRARRVKDLAPRPTRFQGGHLRERDTVRQQQLHGVVEQHPVVLFDVVVIRLPATHVFGQRRLVAAFAQLPDLQVFERHHGIQGARRV
jgi:hypothetical protein